MTTGQTGTGFGPRGLRKALMAGAFLAAMPLAGQSASAATTCDGLARLALPQAVVTKVQAYHEGEFSIPAPAGMGAGGPPGAGAPGGAVAGRPIGAGGPPGGATGFGGPGGGQAPVGVIPAFCRVQATLRPSADSDIRIEVWLPLKGWNGKLVGVGNMGWGGDLPYRTMAAPLQQGYAVAGTDTGHSGNSGAILIGHPEKLIDYAYRADHEMTVKAKAIVKAFFGKGAVHAIWVGCSLGGQEALMEARRYPEDYDGIVAGAPVNPLSRLNAAQLWPAWVNYKFPEGNIPAAKFVMIHDAALKACADAAGQKQGFIGDPESCRFEPANLLCKEGSDPDTCLTEPQVAMLRRLYEGPVNPRTGEHIFPGMPVGGELQWAQDDGGAKPIGVAIDLYKYAVFEDPNWDWKTMDYDTAITKAVEKVDPLLYADPDLTAFLKRGGKLMLYIGWTEYHSALDVRDYYKKVLKNAPGLEQGIRLFEVPGMNHCAGGAGCDTFEKLGTMDDWVTTGKAPEVILSSKVMAGQTMRTRPLCAWPRVARYNGQGDTEKAESFSCT